MSSNISLCSYNTLVLKPPYDGKDPYTKKAKNGVLFGEGLDSRYGRRIAEKIIQLNCDCVALQEVNQASFNKLAEKLWQSGYTGVFTNRNNGEDEGVAIFYRTRRFEHFSNYTHYFNDGSGRGILDVGLKLKDLNISFHIMTSHIDHRPAFIQKEFNIFADHVSKVPGQKIICGDFNVTPDDHMLLPMWNVRLRDSLYGKPHAPTFFNDRRIDYILTSPEVSAVFDAKVIGDPQKLHVFEEPSDHLPLVATVQLAAPIPEQPRHFSNQTRIIVKYDAGFGNKLFIRGSGPNMNWGKGVELRNIDKDTWVYETNESRGFEYKILLNDKTWEKDKNHNIERDKKQEIRPAF